MADCSDVRKKTKYSVTIKGPKLRSWIWCVIVQCFISIPCIFSTCLGVDITVAVFPSGGINVEYGKPLEIFCIAENYTSSDIHFSLGGNPVSSEIVNSTTRRLYIEKPEKQLNTYYCTNTKTNRICTSRVLVDSPPEPVTNFNCISMNLEILNCSWTSPQQYSKVDYNVTFSLNNNLVTPCEALQIPSSNIRYCVWNSSSKPRYSQLEETHLFYLTARSVFGSRMENFTLDHFSIVKPNPPIDLKVVENGTHSVSLKWQIPNNIMDFLSCGVDHIIEYQIAKIDNTTYFHTVDTSSLPSRKVKTYRFKLTNLPYAHMQYEVRVYIKSKKAVKKEFWSNYSYVLFYTSSERPRRPPDMIAGAFYSSYFKHYRIIHVYWKQLEEYEEAGENFTYKVIVNQEHSQVSTIYLDRSRSLSYVKLNVSLSALDVTVYSSNAMGSSVNSSHIYIPPESDILKLTSFTKLAYENGTYELSWAGVKNIDNYTLFWCHHNTSNICSGRMDFASLDPHKTRHIIDLPREYRYQFAIAANVGSKTSGMVWAHCDISKEGFVMFGFPVNLYYDAPGNTSVTLRWNMECILQDGIVSGYNITYCPIVNRSTECDKSVKTSNVYIPDPLARSVTIQNLWPHKTYQFTIALNTIYGQKNTENGTALTTTLEGIPTNPINVEISDVRNDSLVISWDPPIHENCIITKYVIYRNGDREPFYTDRVPIDTNKSRRNVTLKGLRSFTNYSFVVQACNEPLSLCSEIHQNQSIFVRTRIGPPSRMKPPTVKYKTGKLKWDPPEYIGAESVAFYQIRRIQDDVVSEILNTTELSAPVIQCDGSISTVSYEVRAVTYDEDLYHGVIYDKNVIPPMRVNEGVRDEYPGEWSDPPNIVGCRGKDGLTMVFIIIGIFVIVAFAYVFIKLYRKYQKMEDIKPVLPSGLGIPEKDISKYPFGGWNPNNKEEKPPSDEMLLLPNSKTVTSSTDIKQKDNFGSSEKTDSTAVLDSRRDSDDRQVCTSDDGSDSSLNLDADTIQGDKKTLDKDDDFSTIDTDSTYLSDHNLKKTPTNNYVQTMVNPSSNYVQSPSPPNSLPQATNIVPQPASSSYVMASLQPPVFPMGQSTVAKNPIITSSGYCAHPDMNCKVKFPNLGLPKLIESETLPTMPTTLPPPAKLSADNSYIQLQSLDSLPSLKPNVNTVPLKPPASSGYVSHGDVVINKHLNNMLIADQLGEESAILDPAMSPDAYCRFSWNTDPANDNLHSLLAESPITTTKD